MGAEKAVSNIYWDGERELFYVKRFLVENPDREEKIITDHAKSYLEIVFNDYRPMAEVVFVKERNKDRKENLEINLEEFIVIRGIQTLGNQLTRDKVLEINALDPLEPPVKEEEIEEEENDQSVKAAKDSSKKDDEVCQTKLFDE